MGPEYWLLGVLEQALPQGPGQRRAQPSLQVVQALDNSLKTNILNIYLNKSKVEINPPRPSLYAGGRSRAG